MVTTTRRRGEREYLAHLLMRSYREGRKVRKETLANLTPLGDEIVALVRVALEGKQVRSSRMPSARWRRGRMGTCGPCSPPSSAWAWIICWRRGLRGTGIDRSEIFVETKIWISDYGYDATLHAFDKCVGKLGVDHIDLLLLHQPLPPSFERTLDAYRALEKLLADGKVRTIGVSDFMPEHLDRLMDRTSFIPAVNQI